MLRVVLRRFYAAIPIVLLVTVITFGMMRLIPGDAAVALAGIGATPAEQEQVRRNLGLDQPMIVQMARWYGSLLRGDLGYSYVLGRPVSGAIVQALPATVSIALYSLVLTLVFGLGSGILAAIRHRTWVDQVTMIVAMLGISMPSFWIALMMIVFFSVNLGWLPTGGYVPFSSDPLGWLRSATMPAVSLALLQLGLLARITRSSVLEVLRQDYIRTARAKGLPNHLVIGKHTLANAMVPIVTVIGIIVSLLISGAVITETIFSVPGVGRLMTSAILNRDYPVIQGGILFLTVSLIAINVLVDITYAWLDPRIRFDRD